MTANFRTEFCFNVLLVCVARVHKRMSLVWARNADLAFSHEGRQVQCSHCFEQLDDS
jgi:hypothetical protein